MQHGRILNRLSVGVMTGTSIDGMDAALVRIHGTGLQMHCELVRHASQPLGDLAPRLRDAAEQKPMTAGEFARLARDLGCLHAEVISKLVADSQPDLICVHGQTIIHQPPISWQIINPAPIAARFKCAVVFDLRQADLAAGGQGAPITPIADWILFRDAASARAIINLGGFCNLTILPRDVDAGKNRQAGARASAQKLEEIRGYDVCACNQILDAVARTALNAPFDADGQSARRGRPDPQSVAKLSEILQRQHSAKRSLGTGDEAAHWVNNQLQVQADPDAIAASAVHAIAACIADAVAKHDVDEIILAGGGARNLALRERIQTAANRPVRISDELGVPIEAREAVAFAILGALCADGVPITLPQVTGCRTPAPVAGHWTGIARR